MAKKKSLGSSPIGYSRLGMSSFHFIPDLGISKTKKDQDKPVEETAPGTEKIPVKEEKTPEKKIVSYYLEKQLVNRLKLFANENGMYYSAVVHDALEYWIEDHGF